MKQSMKKHCNCPCYDRDRNQCSREGCFFLIPCEVVNESYHKVAARIIKKRG